MTEQTHREASLSRWEYWILIVPVPLYGEFFGDLLLRAAHVTRGLHNRKLMP